MEENNILLELLKEELFITWDDERTNSRLNRIINNAIVSMNYKLGAELDYTMEGMEQHLFLQYCVYAFNGTTNEFDNNYYHEINQIRAFYEVNDNEK